MLLPELINKNNEGCNVGVDCFEGKLAEMS